MVLNNSVLAFNVAGFAEPFRERCRMASGAIERSSTDKTDHRHRRLLRPRREWPYHHRLAKQRDELAPVHSITSSARASSVGGTARPSALAVLRLITNSYVVGTCTGRSAGFSPFRMRST